ncbi:hypothetical protein EV383_4148 [Pseudonocardia sediminis]|uniref:Uncharacterized protein n=1 Tax=Pseudonocardia sediminis TaxID=1397368 RepID=A0A4Q7V1D9_PSEST|nr:hypothetical protein [Pseudonocardia sediminis]RZT87238.1 hypothetical protein EV383_4148 [Pseudonocardia sediminis]
MHVDETCPHCGSASVAAVGPARPYAPPPGLPAEGLRVDRPDDEPDRRCLSCAFAWPVSDPYPRWPLTADLAWLTPDDRRRATALIDERFRVTTGVCDAVRASSADAEEPLAAYADLGDWLSQRYADVLGDPVGAGMDRLVVPADRSDAVRLLESANRVCRALELVRSASVVEYDRDVREVGYRLVEFDRLERELDLPSSLGRDLPSAVDPVPDDPDSDEGTLAALLRAGAPEAAAGVDESWESVVDMATAVFARHGSALAWAREAWQVLGGAGLTSFDTHVDRARVACRLLCLDVLRQEFDVRMFDGGAPGYWTLDVDALLDTVDGVDPVVLGMLAERDDLGLDTEADADPEDGWCRAVVDEVVRQECSEVVWALRAHQRDAVVFASLWAAARDDVAYPLSDEAVAWIVDSDLSADKMVAYEWVGDGMPID